MTKYMYDMFISIFTLQVRWSNAPAQQRVAPHGNALSSAGNFGCELHKAVAFTSCLSILNVCLDFFPSTLQSIYPRSHPCYYIRKHNPLYT